MVMRGHDGPMKRKTLALKLGFIIKKLNVFTELPLL